MDDVADLGNGGVHLSVRVVLQARLKRSKQASKIVMAAQRDNARHSESLAIAAVEIFEALCGGAVQRREAQAGLL